MTRAAKEEAEKMRIYLLNIALAVKNGKDGDLRTAINMAIEEFGKTLDRFVWKIAGPPR